MQLKDIKFEKLKRRKRVGRGGSRGKTSGRGMNGQRSRSGANIRPAERDFIKKIPKLRGRGTNKFISIQTKPAILNVGEISKAFKKGEDVNPQTLVESRLISKVGGNYPKVKILGKGELSLSLKFSGCQVSESAKEKIVKAGGEIK
ncbi:uL15 family ribosomal protein [Candidatus Azambacteria bacterium]|nr:uL15 family ribosomal protein [Candidatus Azambacteria bacterium]